MTPSAPPHGSRQEDRNEPSELEDQTIQFRQSQDYEASVPFAQNISMRGQHTAATPGYGGYASPLMARPGKPFARVTNQYQPVPPHQSRIRRENSAMAPGMPDESPRPTAPPHVQENESLFYDMRNYPELREHLRILRAGGMRSPVMHNSQNQDPAVLGQSPLMDQTYLAMPSQLGFTAPTRATLLQNTYQVDASSNIVTVGKRPVDDGHLGDEAGPAEKRPKARDVTQRPRIEQPVAGSSKRPTPSEIIVIDSDVTSDQSSTTSSPTMTPTSLTERLPPARIADSEVLDLQVSQLLMSPGSYQPLRASEPGTPSPASSGYPSIVSQEMKPLLQLRKNNERLMSRFEGMQRQIDMLDAGVRTAQVELNSADSILNKLLNMDNLPGSIFHEIFMASEYIVHAKNLLR